MIRPLAASLFCKRLEAGWSRGEAPPPGGLRFEKKYDRPFNLHAGLRLAGLAMVLGAALQLLGGSSVTRPCLVLIVVDTLRADHLGAYGYPAPSSPRIDEFARQALIYESAVSPAPFTMPAMAALFSGLYPDRAGVTNHTRRDRLLVPTATLAELARAAGYETAAVVSNPWLSNRSMGFDRGFRIFRTKRSTGKRGSRFTAERVTDEALEILAGASSSKPLMLWVHYIDTHMPYRPPLRLARLLGNPEATSRVIEDFVQNPSHRQEIYFKAPYSGTELDKTRQLYDASIRYVDLEIGRLLDAIGRRGKRTIVILTADHGESLGDHGLFFAHDFTLYDELLHVPLLVRLPGVAATRIRAEVSLVDLLPSLCGWLRLDCPTGIDGRSLPLGNGERTSRPVFAVGAPKRPRYGQDRWIHMLGPQGRWRMVRQGSFKLIRIPYPQGARYELYDLRTDPGETRNLFQPKRSHGLQNTLAAWQASEETIARVTIPAAHLGPATREELRALGYLN